MPKERPRAAPVRASAPAAPRPTETNRAATSTAAAAIDPAATTAPPAVVRKVKLGGK